MTVLREKAFDLQEHTPENLQQFSSEAHRHKDNAVNGALLRESLSSPLSWPLELDPWS